MVEAPRDVSCENLDWEGRIRNGTRIESDDLLSAGLVREVLILEAPNYSPQRVQNGCQDHDRRPEQRNG